MSLAHTRSLSLQSFVSSSDNDTYKNYVKQITSFKILKNDLISNVIFYQMTLLMASFSKTNDVIFKTNDVISDVIFKQMTLLVTLF